MNILLKKELKVSFLMHWDMPVTKFCMLLDELSAFLVRV